MLSPSPKKSEKGELARTFQMLLVASNILLTDAYDILFLAFAGVIASLLVFIRGRQLGGGFVHLPRHYPLGLLIVYLRLLD